MGDEQRPRRLYEGLAEQPEAGRYTVTLPEIPGQRRARKALLQVRFSPVSLLSPRKRKTTGPCQAWAIEVREDASTVPNDEEPILWRLLTTHPVENFSQARQCVEWYRQRWHVEQLFRTLKRQGLDVESSQIAYAERLEKLVVMATQTAVQTLQLILARDGASQRPDTDCFDAMDRPLLQHLCQRLEGKTKKQRNPHAFATLAWCSWIIARLGGWKGYASERKPGPITMFNGLHAWRLMKEGWSMADERTDE